MKPITDFTITFCVLKEDNFFSLPKETQRLIGLYASDFNRVGEHVGFSIATYRLKELGFQFDSEGKVVWEKNKALS